MSDCGYGGDSSSVCGFAYHVSGCGSYCRRPSLLETCCGGCAGRAGSPFVINLIRGRASTRVSTRVSTTPIELWPANNRCGCYRRCWPHGAWFVWMPCYLKLHSTFSVEARDGWYTMIRVSSTVSFGKVHKKQCIFTPNDRAPLLPRGMCSCWSANILVDGKKAGPRKKKKKKKETTTATTTRVVGKTGGNVSTGGKKIKEEKKNETRQTGKTEYLKERPYPTITDDGT